jgi:uncharacterized protein (DUF1330 family)
MPAYLVFERDSTLNKAELETYWSKIRGTFEGHAVKVLAAYGKHEVLEGPPIEGAVIAEFPTPEAAKAWYLSPAYQEVAKHRKKGASYRGFIVSGV